MQANGTGSIVLRLHLEHRAAHAPGASCMTFFETSKCVVVEWHEDKVLCLSKNLPELAHERSGVCAGFERCRSSSKP
jgi:hypothetical protein